MTDEEIERLVTRIIHRLQPPVLVMVTAADGYRQAIRRVRADQRHLAAVIDALVTNPPRTETKD